MNANGASSSRRRFQFSIQMLLVLMLAVALWLGYRTYMATKRDRTREYARLVVANELTERHWQAWETDKSAFVDTLVAGLSNRAAGQDWSYRFLPPDRSNAALGDFEKQFLSQIAQGKEETLRVSSRGDVVYLQAIRSSSTCDACHGGMPLGGLKGVRPGRE